MDKLNSLGIKWLTISALKLRVKRAYDIALKETCQSNVTPSLQPSLDSDAQVPGAIAIPPPPNVIRADITHNIATMHKRGGRPKGSTNEFKSHVDKCIIEAKNEITELYYDHYVKMKQGDGGVSMRLQSQRVPKGTYKTIHDMVKTNCKLPDHFTFPYKACQKRIARYQLNISEPGKKSPLHEIEPHFVTLMLALSDTGNPLTVGQCLPLINSLLQNTSHQKRLIAWKKKHYLHR